MYLAYQERLNLLGTGPIEVEEVTPTVPLIRKEKRDVRHLKFS